MALQFDKPAQSHAETPRGVVVVRGHENSLAGWAATKSCDTAPATVVDGSQTSHSLQLAVKTEMPDGAAFRCACSNGRFWGSAKSDLSSFL